MTETGRGPVAGVAGPVFAERHVAVDGIRCLEAGQGAALVVLPGADGLRLGRAHDLLAERFRVIGLEISDAVSSPSGQAGTGPLGERSMEQPARRAARAISALRLDRYSVMGTSVGGILALRLATQDTDHLDAVVLESPAAVDPDLEAEIASLRVPTLLLFGTLDRVTPAGTRRLRRDTLGTGHTILVYNASHTIAADRPDAFARLVGDFLERREQFVVNRSSGLIHP